MENRINELKAKALALQKVMDEKEEILRSISENMGNMSKELNDYQIKFETNLKQFPALKDKLQKKEKIIEQEKHDEKIISEKISQIQKQRVKLMQDKYKLEQRVQKKPQQVQPFAHTQDPINQSKIQSYLSQQNQQIQKHTQDLVLNVEQFQNKQNQQHEDKAINDNKKLSTVQEKIEVKRKESSNDEDEEKSDEDCDDILKRIKANLKNEDDDNDDESDQKEESDNKSDEENEESNDENENNSKKNQNEADKKENEQSEKEAEQLK